jgi:ACS family D-galactonate transporter-like MFS transporter
MPTRRGHGNDDGGSPPAAHMNFFNNVMGIAAPIVTGYIVGGTQSFSAAFLTAAGVLVVGILSYIFLLGKIEPIPEPA